MYLTRFSAASAIVTGMFVAAVEGQTCPGAQPPADYCDAAYVIDGAVGHHIVFTDVSTTTPGGAQIYATAGHTVWFSVTPEVSGMMTMTTCHTFTTYDTVMEVYSGGELNCDSMTLEAWNDDTPTTECLNGCSNYSASVTLYATAGTRYRFMVGSYNNNQAGCDLCLGVRVTIGDPCGEPPSLGGCEDAYEFPGSAGLHEVIMDVQSAWGHFEWVENPLCPGVYEIGHAVWFKVTPEVCGTMTFTTCHPTTTYDTVIYAFRGDCNDYEYLDCSDDVQEPECDNGCSFYGSRVELGVLAGQPYWFRIGSYNNNSQECDLCLGAMLEIVDICSVDETPPIAEITAPNDLGTACTCAGTVSVTGTADDPDGFFYAYGVDVRSAGGGEWQNITVSTDPVTEGELASWDTSGLEQGYYLLKLSVVNICGSFNTDDVVLYLDTQFDDVSVRYPPEPSPALPIVRGNVCVDGTVFESWCWDPATTSASYSVEYRSSGGITWQPVNPAYPIYTQTVVNDPLATWDTIDLLVRDGLYDLVVAAVDDCGFTDSQIREVVVDNTPPMAELFDPGACNVLDGVVAISGTAYDDNLDFWSLQYTGDGESGWVTLASGTQNVVDDEFYQWDVSGLAPCGYTLRLLVYDRSVEGCGSPLRQWSEYLVSVEIAEEECPGDLTGDNIVNLDDLAELLGRYGDVCY